MSNFVLINPFEVPEEVATIGSWKAGARQPTTCGPNAASSDPGFTARCRRIQGSAS
jgi:hypothetical protein